MNDFKKNIRERFDALAPRRAAWREKNAYYHRRVLEHFRFLVPEGAKVLVLGSSTGDLLAGLNPAQGVGVDISPAMVELARERHPHLEFFTGDAEDPDTWEGGKGRYDFILLPSLAGYLEDVQSCFENLRPMCTAETRIIVGYYNFLWEPLLKLGEKLKLKMPQKTQNWLSPADFENLLDLADYETVKTERKLLFPKRLPGANAVFAFLGSLPLVNRLCLQNFVVARTRPKDRTTAKSVTVVVPCRNERGNVEQAVTRLPEFGSHQEIVFVEGHSQDGTLEEIKRVQAAYPDKDIKWFEQPGKGKADATWTGFDNASGDILMILDGDLTVPPEDLPKFYQAMVSGKGEFINGSRLVYPMEDEAMRFLNLLGNKFFSLIFTWLLNQRIKDTLCGTKVISRDNYERLKAGRAYFGDFDPFGDFDLLFGASKLNLRIREVPIRYRARSYGETQISRWRHGILLLRMTAFAMRKLKLV